MIIKSAKKQLDKLGYFTFISDERLAIGKKKSNFPELGENTILLDIFCGLFVENNIITVEYEFANISKEKEFPSINTAISFIKKKFPL